ncbi:hypothetical protein MMC07_003547 [Pseudocyphellaria aurata]|nr:hypothetical protein [Pseudocyphellaria aurata]
MSNSTVGQLAAKDQLFCPLQAVTKFPYKFVRGPDSDRVSKAYFAEGKFRARGWTVFYIYTLLPCATKPLLVVPAVEVEDLLFEINSRLKLQLGFPHPTSEPGFLLNFLIEGSPRPRYLGRLTTENDSETMESKIPGSNFKQDGEEELDPRSFPAFRVKMEAAVQAGKNRSKASKEKKKRERIIIKGSWCAQLKRARCYLGIRPRWSPLPDPHSIPNLSWEEEQKAMEEEEIARASRVRKIDVTKPVPNPFHENVIFISIDVESYERDRKAVTEIGVSTLDTNDLTDIPPGEGGVAWMKKIRSRHFRVRETSHLVNSDFITGCADRFEKDFGTSEWISIGEAPQVVASCFKPPYSDPDLVDRFPENPFDQTDHASHSNGALLSDLKNEDDTASKRNIILVGHDIKADIDYLRGIGYDVSGAPGLLEAIDTADIFRALKHEHQPRNLGNILVDLGLVGWNLHNAGNDAAYTLQAVIGTCLKSRQSRQEMARERDARMEDVAEEARQQVKQDGQEWSEADNNDEDDGGQPVQLIKQDPALNPRNGDSKVNRAERLARENLAAKKQKEDEEAAKVASGDIDAWGTKNETTEWADQGVVVSSNIEGTKLDNATTAAVEDERHSTSASRAAPGDRGSVDSGFGLDGMQEHGVNETSHAGVIPATASFSLQKPTVDKTIDESVPVSTRLLDRLAMLDAMDDDEEGGVPL